MPQSRRSFLSPRGLSGSVSPLLLAARGREAAVAEGRGADAASETAEIRVDSNENPLGPGPNAMAAFVDAFKYAGRYPTNSRPSSTNLRETIARRLSVRPENVALGSGSWELLAAGVRLFTSSSRHLVTAAPSFEQPQRTAEDLGVGVKRIPVDADGRLDLDRMAQAARYAGLVFLCNPNNPTSTVHSGRAVAEFVARVKRESPDTAILIDEAYHDYVIDPAYSTSVPLALEYPNVFVVRTFSKAYGMAGLRVGYAIGRTSTIEPFHRWAITFNQNSLAVAAAIAALEDPAHIDAEAVRNAEVRVATAAHFKGLGYKVMDSQTNFLFVDIGQPAGAFKEACAKLGVRVGREFPPLEKTCARVSLGTADEMRRAQTVFASVLAPGGPVPAASTKRK